MSTVNSVDQIKNVKAREFHAENLESYQKQFNKLNAKLVFANNEKRAEIMMDIDSLKANYNNKLREYTAQ